MRRVPPIVAAVKAVALGTPVARVGSEGEWVEPGEWQLDPINELSLAWAVDAARPAGVTAVAVGGAAAALALRAALSRGCERALRIDPGEIRHPDVASTAALLAAAAQRTGAAVVAFGYESYDASSGALPAATAAALGWPVVSRAREARLGANVLVVTRSRGLDDETVEVPLPCVVSFVEGGIVPPHPRLAAVMATRKAGIPSLPATDLVGHRGLSTWTTGLRGVEPIPARDRETRVLDAKEGVREVAALVAAARGEEPKGG